MSAEHSISISSLETGTVATVSVGVRQEEFEAVAAAPGARRLDEALRRRRPRLDVAPVVVGGCKNDGSRQGMHGLCALNCHDSMVAEVSV